MGTYGWDETTVTTAVVETVAAEEDCSPEELTPLYEAIDPDALEALFADGPGQARSDRRVVFRYAGYEVSVSSERGVELTKPEAALAD